MLAFVTLLTAGSLAFTAPPAWTTRPPASRMRVAEFVVPAAAGDSEPATLIVYFFGGQGGSADANIERWIGQMQQPNGRPSTGATRTVRTVNGLKVSMVDVSGTYIAEMSPGSAEHHNNPGYRLRGAVIETPGGPYFVKMTGPAKTMSAAGAAYDQFIASLKYEP